MASLERAPTLVIAGYYGFGNWGDEAVLSVLLTHLRQAIPQAQVVVLSHDPLKTEALHDVGAVNRWNPLSVRRALRSAAAFILGPGSVLQDSSSTRSLYYYLGLIRWVQRLKLPIYLLGQGIGPLRSLRSERWVAQALQSTRLVLLRDRTSYEWALAQGVSRLIWGEDLALLWAEDLSPGPSRRGAACCAQGEASLVPTGEGIGVRFSSGRERDGVRVGLSLRPGLSTQQLQTLHQALLALEQKLPVSEWRLLPFNSAYDEPLLRAIGGALQRDVSMAQAQSPLDLLREMHSLDLVIGMRLHSLVFALLAGVPFYALSYDPKIEGFLTSVEDAARLKLSYSCTSEEFDEALLIAKIEAFWAERESIQRALVRARDVLRTRAAKALQQALQQMGDEVL